MIMRVHEFAAAEQLNQTKFAGTKIRQAALHRKRAERSPAAAFSGALSVRVIDDATNSQFVGVQTRDEP